MTWRAIQAGLRTLLRRRDVDGELDDEIAHYIEQAARENQRAGMSTAEAERMARARLGSVASVHEQALSSRWESVIESMVVIGGRHLRRVLCPSPPRSGGEDRRGGLSTRSAAGIHSRSYLEAFCSSRQ